MEITKQLYIFQQTYGMDSFEFKNHKSVAINLSPNAFKNALEDGVIIKLENGNYKFNDPMFEKKDER